MVPLPTSYVFHCSALTLVPKKMEMRNMKCKEKEPGNGNCKEIITVLGREDGKQFDGESFSFFFDGKYFLSPIMLLR